MPSRTHTLSTADQRRETVVESAITVFSRSGYATTPISAVAEHAKISPAYVFKLFPAKVSLFVAAIERCYKRIVDALESGAADAKSATPADVLSAMGAGYAVLIADRRLLMLQVHAQAATDVPEIADAVRRGIAQVTTFAASRSGGSPAEVQQFVAFGQLCHLLTSLDLFDTDQPWAGILTDGIRHLEPEGGVTP
jgi:AcrR family transcriptional regulator